VRTVALEDGTRAYCLKRYEARVLAREVAAYLAHGIAVAPGDAIVDVGANIGLFALHVLRRCGGDAALYCVEPIPEIREVLRRNLAAARAVIVPWAIGRDPGLAEMTYFPRAPGTSTSRPDGGGEDWPAVVRREARAHPRFGWAARALPPLVFRLAGRYLRGASRRVPCERHTLSELFEAYGLRRIALLKVDIEGDELDALRGIRQEHWTGIGQVVAEVHDRARDLTAMASLLEKQGLSRQVVAPAAADSTGCCTLYARRDEGISG
jgi:FkbM family methyltransferase